MVWHFWAMQVAHCLNTYLGALTVTVKVIYVQQVPVMVIIGQQLSSSIEMRPVVVQF